MTRTDVADILWVSPMVALIAAALSAMLVGPYLPAYTAESGTTAVIIHNCSVKGAVAFIDLREVDQLDLRESPLQQPIAELRVAGDKAVVFDVALTDQRAIEHAWADCREEKER
jgi:hypothetical protein